MQDIRTTDTVQNHPLGTIVKAEHTPASGTSYGMGEYIYLKGVASTVVGSIGEVMIPTLQQRPCLLQPQVSALLPLLCLQTLLANMVGIVLQASYQLRRQTQWLLGQMYSHWPQPLVQLMMPR